MKLYLKKGVSLFEILFSVLLVLAIVYQFFHIRSLEGILSKDRTLVAKELHSFKAELGRSNTRFAKSHKELRAILDNIPDKIQEDIDRWGTVIKSVSTFRFSSSSSGKGAVTSVRPPVAKDSPPSNCNWEYSDWRLTGNFKGTCGEGSFDYKLSQVFDGTLISGESTLGSPSYLKIWELDSEGSKLPDSVKLIGYDTVRVTEPLREFRWLSPHLDLGVSFDLWKEDPSFRPTLGLSVSGYGHTKDDLDWRFLRGSISSSDDSIILDICPVAYNLGKNLPLFSNIWLSACYSFGPSSLFSLNFSAIL